MVLCGGCQPALLIRQSMRPNLLAVKSITLLMSSTLDTSARTNSA